MQMLYINDGYIFLNLFLIKSGPLSSFNILSIED